MAYQIKAVDIRSGVNLYVDKDSLQYRMGTGQTINGFYYDCVAHTAHWYYCGEDYLLENIHYDYTQIAKDYSGFCGFNKYCREVDFYNAVGELICRYHVGDDIDFPVELGDTMIKYIFMTDKEVWWIYHGKRVHYSAYSGAEKIEIGFHNNLCVKEMSRLRDSLYNAEGERLYHIEFYPYSLTIADKLIQTGERKARPLVLERYNLIAVCEIEDFYFTSISLYDFNGELTATVPLPEGTVAFHSVKLLEHTDIPVIACFEELPDTSRYFNNGIATSVRPNMPMKLRWFELLPDDSGELVLYKSGELYQGFRDIDTFTLADRHVFW